MADRTIRMILRAEVDAYKRSMAEAAAATSKVGTESTTTTSALGRMVASARDNREEWQTTGTALLAVGGAITGIGAAALKAGIEYAVVDMGPQKPQKGGVLFAAVAGLCDAGMDIPHGDVFPAEDRLLGKHIDEGIEAEIESLKKKMEAE